MNHTLSLVRAVPLDYRCWQLDRRPDDDYSPHFRTEEEALTEAETWVEDGQPVPAVSRLREPCLVAVCRGCGADMEHSEFGDQVHYSSAGDAEQDAAELACADGCEVPEVVEAVVAAVEPVGMEPLPGFEEAS